MTGKTPSSTKYLVAAAALLLALTPASAAPISVSATITGTGPTPLGQAISLTLNGVPSVAFGIDVTMPLIYGTFAATVDTVDSVNNGGRAAWIYENYAGATADGGMAVQLALWDLFNDGGDGFDAGLVRLSPSVPALTRELATAIIASSVGQASTQAVIVRLTSPFGVGLQSLITSPLPPGSNVSHDATTPNPEPGTLMMMAAGLALAGCYTRRK